MIKEEYRRTKVIWSLESEVLGEKLIKEAEDSAVDAIRIVYEPRALDKIVGFISEVNRSSTRLKATPLILDVGTSIRGVVTDLNESKELSYGQTVRFTPKGSTGGDLKIQSDEWPHLFKEGELAYLAYGNVVFDIKKVSTSEVIAQVVQGGMIYPGIQVQVPATKPPSRLKDIDLSPIKTFLQDEVDLLVIPGILDASEIEMFRQKLSTELKQPPWIILKIDSKEAADKLDGLIDFVDGIFISRREMALTMEPSLIPMETKEIVQLCNDRAKMVMTASDMLWSMRHKATPTRAEVSDIANAVLDGTDAVVLSEEVMYGPYGIKALNLMPKIIEDAESLRGVAPNWIRSMPKVKEEMDAIAFNAYKTAERVGAKAIVCITKEGNTALKLASFRAKVPIIAVTFSRNVLEKLSLIWGVQAILLEVDPNLDDVLPLVNDKLLRDSWLKPSDRIVFVSITLSSLGRESSNLFTVQKLS